MLTIDPSIMKKECITANMLLSLEFAHQKYKNGSTFDLKEIAEFKITLINRDLLELTSKYIIRKHIATWQITKKGLNLMQFLIEIV